MIVIKFANKLRIFFGLMYFCTSFINLYLGLTNAEMLRGLAEGALIGIYRAFALQAPDWMLTISLIGFFVIQLILAGLLLSKGKNVKVGLWGGIVFHLLILPWGLWSLPNLIFVLAYLLLLKYNYQRSLLDMIKD